jgi:hypothetical protein
LLDWAHRLVLQGVADGDDSQSPALQTLVATGLVAYDEPSGTHQLTEAGQAALEASKPSRSELTALGVMTLALLIFAVDAAVGWVT